MLATGLAALSARAADLVTFSFNGNLSPTTEDGVTASGFLGNGGSNAVVGLGNNDGSYGYILIKDSSDNAGEAVSNKQFAQFSVTPPAKNGMQITGLTFIGARGGNSTPRGVVVRSSLDNYSQNLGTVTIGSTWPNKRTYTLSFNFFAGNTVTFRIYAYAKEQSQVEPSVRFSELTLEGFPVVYPPTVTPDTTSAQTRNSAYTIRGAAYDSAGISRVEVARNSATGVYSGANGTTRWNYRATSLRVGKNVFYVRAVDKTGQVGSPVKVTIRRTKSGSGPGPKPSPTP